MFGGIVAIPFSEILVSFLTVTFYPKLEHDIESLLRFPGHVGTLAKAEEYQTMMDHANPKVQLLATKFKPSLSFSNAWKWVKNGEYAFMNSRISTEYLIRTNFTDRYKIHF